MAASRDDDTSLTLMMRVQKNPADPRAWDEFVQRYQPIIRTWCLKWGSQPSDADDVAQEVLLKLLSAMRKFQYDPARSFRAWLKTVTQNAWNDFVTSPHHKSDGSSQRIGSIADSRDALTDLERQMEDAFERELLELAMHRVEKRVKPTTWQAFRLTAIENRPGAETAKQLQMQVAHVYVAKHRVQKMLEEEMRILKGES
jgi:RNA polymerase sigma-70 factor (ECF subfamily)